MGVHELAWGVGSGRRVMNEAQARRLASDGLGVTETWLCPGVAIYSRGDHMVCEEQKILREASA